MAHIWTILILSFVAILVPLAICYIIYIVYLAHSRRFLSLAERDSKMSTDSDESDDSASISLHENNESNSPKNKRLFITVDNDRNGKQLSPGLSRQQNNSDVKSNKSFGTKFKPIEPLMAREIYTTEIAQPTNSSHKKQQQQQRLSVEIMRLADEKYEKENEDMFLLMPYMTTK